MLLSDEEYEMLQALADADGITASDLIRQYIRRAHAEKFVSKAKTKKTK